MCLDAFVGHSKDVRTTIPGNGLLLALDKQWKNNETYVQPFTPEKHVKPSNLQFFR